MSVGRLLKWRKVVDVWESNKLENESLREKVKRTGKNDKTPLSVAASEKELKKLEISKNKRKLEQGDVGKVK